MKKLLLALLTLPALAFADVPRTITRDDIIMAMVRFDPANDGTIFIQVFDTPDHKLYCYPIPLSRIRAIPQEWTLAISLGAYELTEAERVVCNLPPKPVTMKTWVVAPNLRAIDNPPTRPLIDPTTRLTIGRVRVDMQCELGDPIGILSGGLQYRFSVNDDGIRGLAVCTLK